VHEQDHHGEAEFHLSVHPADIPQELFDYHQHQEDKDPHEHEHKNKHYDGDLDYLNQSKIQSVVIYEITAIATEINLLEPQVLERIPITIPLKIPNPFNSLIQANRAPPLLS